MYWLSEMQGNVNIISEARHAVVCESLRATISLWGYSFPCRHKYKTIDPRTVSLEGTTKAYKCTGLIWVVGLHPHTFSLLEQKYPFSHCSTLCTAFWTHSQHEHGDAHLNMPQDSGTNASPKRLHLLRSLLDSGVFIPTSNHARLLRSFMSQTRTHNR